MSPQRIQLRRTKGWRIPEGAVIVDRRTKWGNPNQVTHCDAVHVHGRHWHVFRDGWHWIETTSTKQEAVKCAVNLFRPIADSLKWTIRDELRGKDLACWCPLDQPCHADVLLEIANGRAP